MRWYDLGEAAFTAKGSALPSNPDDTYCCEVGIAEALGFIRTPTADTLVNARPAASRPFRMTAIRILRNLP